VAISRHAAGSASPNSRLNREITENLPFEPKNHPKDLLSINYLGIDSRGRLNREFIFPNRELILNNRESAGLKKAH
jgi:hypothetical protein